MRFGFYDEFRPCLVKPDGVVDISDLVGAFPGAPPQYVLETLINKYGLAEERTAAGALSNGRVIPLAQVKLRAPVPRPGKVLCGRRNFKEGVPLDPPGPLRTFFKSPDAVIGPGETVILPAFRASIFNHEAELALVIGKAAKDVPIDKAMEHVFGYTTSGDVSARGPVEGEAELAGPYGKCFDTFLPLGPAIVTPDEVGDPNKLQNPFLGQWPIAPGLQYRRHGAQRRLHDLDPVAQYDLAAGRSHSGRSQPFPSRPAAGRRFGGDRDREGRADESSCPRSVKADMAARSARPAGQYPPPRRDERQAAYRDLAASAVDRRRQSRGGALIKFAAVFSKRVASPPQALFGLF